MRRPLEEVSAIWIATAAEGFAVLVALCAWAGIATGAL
jgi:hypothetical protein